MKNPKLKTIRQICNNISVLCIFITLIFSSILSIIIFLNTSKKSIDLEMQRLCDITPLITRPLQANFIIGDERSFKLLKRDLMAKYRLSDLYITNYSQSCSQSTLKKYFYFLRVGRICLSSAINNSSKSLFVNLEPKLPEYNFSSLFSLLLWVNLPLVLLGLFISTVMKNRINSAIVNPINTLANNPSNFKLNSFKIIALEVRELYDKLTSYMAMSETQKIKDLQFKITTQVAHDIRSPLAALEVATNFDFIPEDKRILIRNATNRIKDIANNLLSHYAHTKESTEKTTIDEKIIVDMIESVVSEKRLQYHYLPIEIIFDFSKIKFNTFVKVNPSDFKRIISNIINNSVEAIVAFPGRIIIELLYKNDCVMIVFSDTGKGIESQQIKNILNGNIVSNKDQGYGLGLSYSINKVKTEWFGIFEMESELNKGTVIKITLPKSSQPKCFASEICFSNDQLIIILDDDPSIHDAWGQHFPKHLIINFYKVEDFFNWYSQSVNRHAHLYLFDYELLNSPHSGLDVLERINYQAASYLVTSNYDQPNIQQRCNELSIKLIPKAFVPYIPVTTKEKFGLKKIILIDDNESLRTAWYLAAIERKLNFSCFSSINEFNAKREEFELDTYIYIDSELEDNLKGEIYAMDLAKLGFTEIYLTTGHSAESFKDMPWIKGIVGKYPPYL